MKMFTLLVIAIAASQLHAAAETNTLKLRPSRQLKLSCETGVKDMPNQIRGSSDEISVVRVSGASDVRYEVYRDGFLQATCINVTVAAD